MEFVINRDTFLKSLGHAYGIIEKKTTLPILSNVLIEAKDSKIRITATDLDIIYSEVIPLNELKKEGTTTTSASVLYDILRKLEANSKVELSLQGINKLKLSNVIQDPSFIREVLSYEIARKYMPASLANFANLYINDTLWGL